VQAVAERTGLVTAMDLLGQGELGFDPLGKFNRGKLLCRLRGAVVEDAHHHDCIGVNVQAQLDGLMFLARGLLRANFGDNVLLLHIVGGCSAFVLARQLLMSSPRR
jgi:hypothetical protein